MKKMKNSPIQIVSQAIVKNKADKDTDKAIRELRARLKPKHSVSLSPYVERLSRRSRI
jgi:hypothetical protein